MECSEIRDHISSLWEGEITPSEAKPIRDHLSACSECQREFETFDKIMKWLLSAEEVEVPAEFLRGTLKKMNERKRSFPEAIKTRWRGLFFPLAWRVPVKAVAMVGVVFLVIYLTKIMPVEPPPLMKEAWEKSPAHGGKQKENHGLVLKEKDKERESSNLPPEVPRVSAPEMEKREGAPVSIPQKTDVTAAEGEAEALLSKDIEKREIPAPEPKAVGKTSGAEERSSLILKPLKEIPLRFLNSKEAVSQIEEMVERFGGKMVKTEDKGLLVLLPMTSLPTFERELAGLGSSMKVDPVDTNKYTAREWAAAPGAKDEKVDEKKKKSVRVTTDREESVIVRIVFLQE